jgi:predicted  nucleic acid-binding Zn-ribbon protein
VSDTPRTDAAFRSAIREANDSAEPLNEMIGFSMKLERELNAANERIKQLEAKVDELHDLEKWLEGR